MRRAKELRRYLEALLNSDPVGAFLSSPKLHDLLQARRGPTGPATFQLPAAVLRLPAWSSRADPQAIVHALRCRTVQLSESARVALRQVAQARGFGSLIVLQIIAARNLPPPGTGTLPLS